MSSDGAGREGMPLVWAIFTPNGNIRIWTASTLERGRIEDEHGPMTPLYGPEVLDLLRRERERAAQWEAEADKQFQYAGRVLEQAHQAESRLAKVMEEHGVLVAAARQASFCLRELLPNDNDAKMTVGMLTAALAADSAREERDNWQRAAEAIRLNHQAYSDRAELAESQRDALTVVLKKLALMAQTTGGTAGPDAGLIAAIDEAERTMSAVALKLAGVGE